MIMLPGRFVQRCRYCQVELVKKSSQVVGPLQRAATRDHVIPQSKGGLMFLKWSYALPPALRVRNWVWACGECNQMRAACGHCVGAMACLHAVAKSLKMRPNLLLRRWQRMVAVTSATNAPRGTRHRHKPNLRFDDQPGRTR